VGALGARAGVGVAIMMPNSPERLFVYFATQRIGGWSQGKHKP
jgi:acyl-coenzyme A synthetase/AMP-(fatty) acid ligase